MEITWNYIFVITASTRHTRAQFTPRNRVTLNFPKESDVKLYWQILEQLGWLPYVEGETRPEEQKEPKRNPLTIFRNAKPDNRPYEELMDEMYHERYGIEL